MSASRNSQNIVKSALTNMRGAFIGIAVLSAVSNILMLVSPLFMMQIYDRVLTSRSLPTLAALSILAFGIYVTLGIIELLRSKILLQIGRSLDEQLSQPAVTAAFVLPLMDSNGHSSSMPLRDLDQIRTFMSGPGPIAFADLPWMPFFFLILYLFHPIFGITILGGAIVLLVMTVLSEIILRGPSKRLAQYLSNRWDMVDAGRRNADTMRAMGMRTAFSKRFSEVNERYIEENLRSSNVTSTFGAISKTFRLGLQSAMLAIGALLVIDNLASPGAIIAASLLTAKALSPIEMVTGQWRSFLSARQSARRLQESLERVASGPASMTLPTPYRSFSVAGLGIAAPGSVKPIVQNISISMFAGQALAVIGPSGSGKSSLGRALTGAWPAARGVIRLDGAELGQWDAEQLGPSIGYLAQNVELFSGTIADNISRFSDDATPQRVIEAAMQANVHHLILSMPNGYDTQIGTDGAILSGGQRQRIGLARALYGNPFLIVLDEPNSNLDVDGDMALVSAVNSARERGAIVIIIAHRPNLLQVVDQVMVLGNGTMTACGPRNEIMQKMAAQPTAPRKIA